MCSGNELPCAPFRNSQTLLWSVWEPFRPKCSCGTRGRQPILHRNLFGPRELYSLREQSQTPYRIGLREVGGFAVGFNRANRRGIVCEALVEISTRQQQEGGTSVPPSFACVLKRVRAFYFVIISQKRMNIVATSARLAPPAGFIVLSVLPLMRPAPTAHSSASLA